MHQALKYLTSIFISLGLTTLPLIGQDITTTITVTPTTETTLEAIHTLTPENTATVFVPAPTETLTPTSTETLLPSMTLATATPTLSSTAPTATPIPPSLLLQTVSGYVYYQNSADNQHANIEIEIFTDSRQFIASAITDAAGVYQVAVPLALPFWIVADAPLHRENAVRVLPGEALPVLVLLGGDLNDDDCVTLADLQLFGEQSIAADINQDAQLTIADVAILTGNLQTTCEIFARTLPATPTIGISLTPENTLLPSATWTMASATPLPVTSAPVTAVFTETSVAITPTETPSPAATWTPTMTDIVPTEVLPAATVESTPEIHGS